MLTIDEKVESGNLDSFGKGANSANFEFEGDLNFEYFATQKRVEESESLDSESESEDSNNTGEDNLTEEDQQ